MAKRKGLGRGLDALLGSVPSASLDETDVASLRQLPVDLIDTRFVNAHGEDALNVFGTHFLMERVLIDGVASDAFDGDFVTGTVKDCTVMNSVEDGVDGRVFPVGDRDALARCLAEIVADAGARRRLAGTARERVAHDHGFDLVLGRYLELYSEVTARRG